MLDLFNLSFFRFVSGENKSQLLDKEIHKQLVITHQCSEVLALRKFTLPKNLLDLGTNLLILPSVQPGVGVSRCDLLDLALSGRCFLTLILGCSFRNLFRAHVFNHFFD